MLTAKDIGVDVKTAYKKLSDKSSRSTGTGCHFVKMSDELGIKCYSSRERATKAFVGQKWGESLGIAPRVLSDDVFFINDYWCYATEIVETLVDIQGEGENGNWTAFEEYKWKNSETWDTIKNWCYDLDQLGLWYTDCHPGNFGLLNQEPVIIDWDRWFCFGDDEQENKGQEIVKQMLGEEYASECFADFGTTVSDWGVGDNIR